MARIKPSVATRKRHKKVLSKAKGYTQSSRKLYRKAKEATLRAGAYAYTGRKLRKRDARKLWITRLSATLKSYDINYSQFIAKLKSKKIELDRKTLSEIAVNKPHIFEKLVKLVTA